MNNDRMSIMLERNAIYESDKVSMPDGRIVHSYHKQI